jgi:hypothetical protein
MPTRTHVKLTTKIRPWNSLYHHRHFIEQLVDLFEKPLWKSNLNNETSESFNPVTKTRPASSNCNCKNPQQIGKITPWQCRIRSSEQKNQNRVSLGNRDARCRDLSLSRETRSRNENWISSWGTSDVLLSIEAEIQWREPVLAGGSRIKQADTHWFPCENKSSTRVSIAHRKNHPTERW